MEMGLLRISADGCRVNEGFEESLVDTISADNSGMHCGPV